MNNITNEKKAGYESIRLFLKQQVNGTQKVINLISIPVIIYLIWFLFGIFNHTLMDAGYPNEYREAANVLLTKEFMSGNNPYSLSALNGNLPPMVYLYGPLYSVIVALVGKVVHVDVVLLHYMVTFAAILISAFLGAWITAERTSTITAPLAAFLFLITCHWRYNYVNAVPDSMALMLMIVVFFVLTRKRFRHKAIVCAALTLSMLLTKQYFLLIAGTVTAWLFLFEKKAESFRYLFYLAVLTAAGAFIIQWKMPLFWTYLIYFAKGPGSGVAGTVTRGTVKMSGEAYNFMQIMSIGGMYLMLFITETIGVVVSFFRKRLDRVDLLMLGHMAVAGICLLYIGKNDGAWLSYYLELFVPALVIGAMIMIEKVMLPDSKKLAKPWGIRLKFTDGIAAELPKKEWFVTAYAAFYLLLVGFTILRTGTRLPVSPLNEENYEQWEEAETLLDANKGDMYLYPPLAYYGIRNGIYIYNTGQPFVITEKFYNRYLESEEDKKSYPYAGEIFSSHLEYREKVKEKVRNGEYSVVTYITDYDQVFDENDLKEKYKPEKTLTLKTGRWSWDVQFWVLK